MPNKSLSRSSLLSFQKYSSLLAGNDPFIPSFYELLETEILTSSQASVTFSSLGSYSDYQHLQLRVVGRGDIANNTNATYIQLNSDTGTNYAYHSLRGTGSGVFSGSNTSMSDIFIGEMAGGSFTTDGFGAAVVDILDFSNSNKNTTIKSLHGLAGNHTKVRLLSGFWNNTAAVTTITVLPLSDSFVAGSRFSLYGWKAA